MIDTNLNDLHPSIRPLYLKLVDDLASKTIIARIIQGWRDPAYQLKLIAQGGVTKVPPDKDKHCFTLNNQPASKAFDLGVFNQDTSYVTDGNDVRYTIAGGLWRQYAVTNPDLHLLWGGNFIHAKPDPDHFEIG